MTVCIGAVNLSAVIVASDRMISTDDVAYEQPQSKIIPLDNRMVALVSGDIPSQTELAEATRRAITARHATTVAEAAQLYADSYSFLRQKTEKAILGPFGVGSMAELYQKNLPRESVDDLLARIKDTYFGDDISTIIAGVDDGGPRLSLIVGGWPPRVMDRVGFAAIGVGYRHAEDAFEFAGYAPNWEFSRALYLVYVAKRRAEVTPGVGKQTDFAVIGKSGLVNVPDKIMKILCGIYGVEQKAVKRRREKALADFDATFNELLQAPRATPTVQPTPPGSKHDL